ncbi:Acyltransferase-like protein, chloroplastic [Sesamum angolense]|uniref:Acyltransferase-like protein, chloroplastic n=1 Tax=Sesamum angolense TaxID=2727404 RepID=A0AAE1WGI9_9LAMI|nr:Acyltransferase-like protein, chloroplastic [Sesamum angolense]
MGIAGTAVFPTPIPPFTRPNHLSPSISNSKLSVSASLIPTDKHPQPLRSTNSSFTENGVLENKSSSAADTIPSSRGGEESNDDDDDGGLTLKDYFEHCGELLGRCRWDGGGPRWFSPLPLDSHSRLQDSPLLLSLPDLVKFVESAVRLEHSRTPNRPIYLVGESFGGCLALAVAARNPDIDLMLILANPGREQELKSREKAHELYIEVKSEVEKCLGYLKEKRENDPYRNIFARIGYQARHGFDSEVPTFDI